MEHELRSPSLPPDLAGLVRCWDSLDRPERVRCARSLRGRGWSITEMADTLPISQATASTWCNGAILSSEQAAEIARRGRAKRSPRIDTQWRRRREVERLEAAARRDALRLRSDPLWVAGTVLYWGEGSKRTRWLEVANSEPEALRLFIRWTLRFHSSAAEFRGAINLHRKNSEPGARALWSRELHLDSSTGFTKTYLKPDGTGHRKNHLPHGGCRVRMLRSTNAWLVTMVWLDVARETFGANLAAGR